MPLLRNISSVVYLLFIGCLLWLSSAALGEDNVHMVFKWDFSKNNSWRYEINQKAQVQRFLNDPNLEFPRKSPIHEEFTAGHITLNALSDGNAYGDIILQLMDIREKGISLEMPEEQKIPQKVCRFVMTSRGNMEQYSGPKMETYVLTRLILGVPIEPLKQNEVGVYPFSLFTKEDETSAPVTGRISHEFKEIVSFNGKTCARIVSTLDIQDNNSRENILSSSWKGTSDSIFNIEDNRLEKITWKLALKKSLQPIKEDDPTTSVEIFDISVKLVEVTKTK